MSIEDKNKLLSKTFWTVDEIASYLDVGRNTALKIRSKILEKEPDAKPDFINSGIFVDAVLRIVLHSSRENERRKWQ